MNLLWRARLTIKLSQSRLFRQSKSRGWRLQSLMRCWQTSSVTKVSLITSFRVISPRRWATSSNSFVGYKSLKTQTSARRSSCMRKMAAWWVLRMWKTPQFWQTISKSSSSCLSSSTCSLAWANHPSRSRTLLDCTESLSIRIAL